MRDNNINEDKVATAKKMYIEEGLTIKKIAEHFNVNSATISRWINNVTKPYLRSKPVETTNELPNDEEINNAQDCLQGDNSCDHSKVVNYLDKLFVR
jgi:transposase-like protein